MRQKNPKMSVTANFFMWDYGEERALFCTRSEVRTNHDEKQGHGGLDYERLHMPICGCG